jgi:small subunit ribosomal protein S20
MKKVFTAIASGDKAAATAELAAATKCIEMAASKGVYHKNNMARKVSRISKAVNQMN